MSTLDFIGVTRLGAQSSSAEFDDVDIGTPATDRKLIVVFECIRNAGPGAGLPTPSMTIGGETATLDAAQNGALDLGVDNHAHASIFSLDYPEDATADIVVGFSPDEIFDASIYVYVGTGLGAVLDFATEGGLALVDGSTADVATLDVDVEDGGAIVGGGVAYDLFGPGITWTGLSEDSEETVYSEDRRGSASYLSTGDETPRTVTMTPTAAPGGFSANTSKAAVAVSYSAGVAEDAVGDLSVTLADAVVSASGSSSILGSLSATLAAATLTSTGASAITGALAKTLEAASLVAAGVSEIIGELDQTLADATLSAHDPTPVVERAATRAVWARFPFGF